MDLNFPYKRFLLVAFILLSFMIFTATGNYFNSSINFIIFVYQFNFWKLIYIYIWNINLFLGVYFKFDAAMRSLGVVSKRINEKVVGDYNSSFRPKEDGEQGSINSNDLFSMDYTPASKKPPIHN